MVIRQEKQHINEELTKSQIESIIKNRIDSTLSSRDFKKKVKELSADVVSEIFKLLWQRNNFWKNSASQV